MKDDLLERATRALRDEHTAASAGHGELGKHRLERSLLPASQKRARLRMVTLLVAASFVGLTAWASASGRLPMWLHLGATVDVEGHDRAADREIVAPLPSALRSSGVAPVLSAPATPEDSAPPEEPAASSAPDLTPPAIVKMPAIASSVPRAPSTAAVAPDLDALYRAAHEAQSRHDSPAALALWDRYLAAAGANGRMTLEARYDRAITLVRLGRKDEARAALEPFSRGEYGGYRREEATRLIESLR